MSKIKQVLLVDDNDDTNFYNEDLLEESEFFEEIVVLTNGKDTIAYFEKLNELGSDLPELMFLDVNMPDYEGFEVLEELEQLFEEKLDEMKICMLTTSNHKRDIEKFDKFINAVEFINKPLKIEALKMVIDKHF